MNVEQLLTKIEQDPDNVLFEETMSVIDTNYQFKETAFDNGDVSNKAGENSGSCKLLTFGQLNQLTEKQTLICFGQYYRDVVNNEHGDDHQNIRQFMKYGWNKVIFTQQALKKI